MYSLPGQPNFAVYGPSSSFTGFRWLASWQDHRELYQVTLGYGEPAIGVKRDWVTVATTRKTAARAIAPGITTWAIGVAHAAAGVALDVALFTWGGVPRRSHRMHQLTRVP